ncbi:MAG: ABC transporter permease [Bacilli bacterium]|nr:ABC transporter permease [Bacilli bacterium]
MFLHNLKYSLKTLFKNRMLIFWTYAFPLILGTFFYLAFSNIENSEKFDVIDIAIVNNEQFNDNMVLKESFNVLGDEESDEQLFNIKYVDLEEAIKLLENDEVSGYLVVDESPKAIVKTSGTSETILKYVTEEIIQNENVLANIIEEKLNTNIIDGNINEYIENIRDDALKMLDMNSLEIRDITSKKLSYTMIEFYTLIAMTALYGGIIGMTAINQNLANMSDNGKRIAVSPTNKIKIIFSSLVSSFIIQVIGLFILFMYTIFVLKVDYGNNLPLIILLALVGSLAGLSLGMAVGTILKTNENVKVGIIISFTMLGSFLSGMMGITMKYIIDTNIPLVNKLNPVNMITDGLYSLYYYNTYNRFYFNVVSLLIFSLIMIVLSVLALRRQKYDSI